MRRWISFLFCLALLAGDQGGPAQGAGMPQGESLIRVAVGLGQSSIPLTVMQGGYSLRDPDRDAEIGTAAAGQRIEVSPAGGGLSVRTDGGNIAAGGNRVLFSGVSGGTDILTYGSRSYRGAVVVENKNGALNVINILDVDQYLLGVLPLEMGIATAPAEALKAQAVVSRTFALHNKTSGGSYDLVSGAADQMYGGYGSEKAYATAAVEATRGQAAYYDGRLIEAFFSSNSGGYTEDAENVWNGALPYAKAVPSPYDAYALEVSADSAGYPGNTYRWELRYTVDELAEMIASWNGENPEKQIRVGTLRAVAAYAYAFDPASGKASGQPNASGRITRMELQGDIGTYVLEKENIRSFLRLRSTLFTLTPEGGMAVRNGAGASVMLGQSIAASRGLAADSLPSEINPGSGSFFVATAEGVKELNKEGAGTVTAYLISGKGYGHGVGLSQWGAIGMAAAGMTYGQIIEHYYNQDKNDGRLVIKAVQ